MANEKRKYRRATRFSGMPLTIGLEPDLRRDLEREAERDGLSLADLARQCLKAGLPRVKEASRKRRGKRRGTNGGNGSAQ